MQNRNETPKQEPTAQEIEQGLGIFKAPTMLDLPGIPAHEKTRYFQVCTTTTMLAALAAFRKIYLATAKAEGQPVKYLAGVL